MSENKKVPENPLLSNEEIQRLDNAEKLALKEKSDFVLFNESMIDKPLVFKVSEINYADLFVSGIQLVNKKPKILKISLKFQNLKTSFTNLEVKDNEIVSVKYLGLKKSIKTNNMYNKFMVKKLSKDGQSWLTAKTIVDDFASEFEESQQ